eukprot:6214825-Pleurochrysis_carterae.AAC.3
MPPPRSLYGDLPPELKARVGGFVSEHLPSYGMYLRTSKTESRVMSDHLASSTPRAKTIHMFVEARRVRAERMTRPSRERAQMLELFLGPSLSMEEGSDASRQPTYEQQLQRKDVARFIHMDDDPDSSNANGLRVCLYDLLAMYDYVRYHTLLSHIYLASTHRRESVSDVEMIFEDEYKANHPSRCSCHTRATRNGELCTNAVLSCVLEKVIDLKLAHAMKELLLRDFHVRVVPQRAIQDIMMSDGRFIDVFTEHSEETAFAIPSLVGHLDDEKDKVRSIVKLFKERLRMSMKIMIRRVLSLMPSLRQFLRWEELILDIYSGGRHIKYTPPAAEIASVMSTSTNYVEWIEHYLSVVDIARYQTTPILSLLVVLLEKDLGMALRLLSILKSKYGMTLRHGRWGRGHTIVANALIKKCDRSDLGAMITMVIDTYDLDPLQVRLCEKDIVGNTVWEKQRVLQGARKSRLGCGDLLSLTHWFRLEFSRFVELTTRYLHPILLTREEDLARLGEKMDGVYVDGNVLQRIVEYANKASVVFPMIVSREEAKRYVANAYRFFGKGLQLHMLAEMSHYDVRVIGSSPVFQELLSEDWIFSNLSLYDVEVYIDDDETAKLSLYSTLQTVVDMDRLRNFVSRTPSVRRRLLADLKKRPRRT